MHKLLIFVILGFAFGRSYGQTEVDIRASSYETGRQYYANGDYLYAYRYLLAYKYSHYDGLNNPDKKEAFKELNKVILYCESQIKKGLSSFSSYEGHGYSQREVEVAKSATVSKPSLADSHL